MAYRAFTLFLKTKTFSYGRKILFRIKNTVGSHIVQVDSCLIVVCSDCLSYDLFHLFFTFSLKIVAYHLHRTSPKAKFTPNFAITLLLSQISFKEMSFI